MTTTDGMGEEKHFIVHYPITIIDTRSLAVLTPEPDNGRLFGAACGQVRGHAEGEGAEEDPADPGEPLEYCGRLRQHQPDEHPVDAVRDRSHHATDAEPTATGQSCASHRCHLLAASAVAADSGGGTAAATFPR